MRFRLYTRRYNVKVKIYKKLELSFSHVLYNLNQMNCSSIELTLFGILLILQLNLLTNNKNRHTLDNVRMFPFPAMDIRTPISSNVKSLTQSVINIWLELIVQTEFWYLLLLAQITQISLSWAWLQLITTLVHIIFPLSLLYTCGGVNLFLPLDMVTIMKTSITTFF